MENQPVGVYFSHDGPPDCSRTAEKKRCWRMALKKSQLYSSLWQSCDELRDGMDASQCKDYVLTLLFMKYVSDKPDTLLDVPAGGSFADMMQQLLTGRIRLVSAREGNDYAP